MKTTMRISVAEILIIICCILSACSTNMKQTDQDSLTSEAIFSEDSQYAYLHQVFGDLNSRELFNLADQMMSSMNAAVRAGDATAEDYHNLKRIMQNLHDWMASTEPKTAAELAVDSPGTQILDIMVDNNMGDIMTRAVRSAGGDILTDNVFPMMAYVMACDHRIVKDAVDGITINRLGFDTSELKENDFKNMMAVMHGFLNTEDADYKPIRNAWDTLHAKVDAKGLEITVGDIKDLLPGMDLDDLDNLPVLIDVAHAIHQLYDEDPKIKEDIDKLLYASGHLMSTTKAADGHNSWDTKSMTDLERILFCLEDIIRPDRRDTLKEFVRKVLNAGHGLNVPKADVPNGMDNIYTITQILGSWYDQRDPATNAILDIDEIDYGIYHRFFQLNQLEQPTDQDSTVIKLSEMESIFLLFDTMCRVSDLLEGPTSQNIFSLITLDPTGPTIDTRNSLLEFIVGWWGKSCYEYPRSYHNSFTVPGRPAGFVPTYPDTLQGQDWFFYDNDFTVQGVPLPSIELLLDLLTVPQSFNYLLGIIAETLDCITAVSGGSGTAGTTGQHHKLFKLIAPALKWYYDAGYPAELIHVVLEVNELSVFSYGSIAYSGNGLLYTPTLWEDRYLTNTMTAFETIQGPYGYGLPYYLMRGASDVRFDNNVDIADPALDMLVRMCNKLVASPYDGGNLAKAFCDMLTEKEPKDPDDLNNPDKNPYDYDTQYEDWRDWIVAHLFKADGAVDNLYTFVHDNHSELTQVGTTLGDVMLSAFNPSDKQNDMIYTSDIVGLLQNSVLPKLGSALQANRDAVRTMVINGLNQTDTDSEVSTAAGDYAAALCDKGVRICADLAKAVPGMKQIYDASIVDYTYDPADSKIQPFIDYLTQDVNGQENPFIFNMKSLGYKLTGIYDATYNTKTNTLDFNDDTPVMDVVDHLVGDSGIYDTAPLTNFLRDVSDDAGNGYGDVLWQLIDGGEPWSAEVKHTLEKIFGDDLDNRLSWNFIRSMCLPYNDADPVMLTVFKTIHLDDNGQAIEFTGVMNDISTIIHQYDFQPGTRLFDGIFEALTVVIGSWG